MKLDPSILASFTVQFRPVRFIRVTPIAYRKSPLGMGHGKTRFASPTDAFKLLYIAKDIATGIAETIVRDRFEGPTARELIMSEVTDWGATEVSVSAPLCLLDIREAGCLALGVSTDIKGAKGQAEARQFSQDVYDQTNFDGILYRSRLTGQDCAGVYERAVVPKLSATPVVDLPLLASLVPALDAMHIKLIR